MTGMLLSKTPTQKYDKHKHKYISYHVATELGATDENRQLVPPLPMTTTFPLGV